LNHRAVTPVRQAKISIWAVKQCVLACTLRRLYAALAATMESLVTDVRYDILMRFPIIAQLQKARTTFIVVGLMVINICH